MNSPILLSYHGSGSPAPHILAAWEAGDLEADDGFGPFAGYAHEVSPDTFTHHGVELHEAVWSLPSPGGTMDGELGWFQVGVHASEPFRLPLPLLLRAGEFSLSRLGDSQISEVLVQVPMALHREQPGKPTTPLDQFFHSAPHDLVTVEVSLYASRPSHDVAQRLTAWLAEQVCDPLHFSGSVTLERHRRHFDERWDITPAGQAYRLHVGAPEWSITAVSTTMMALAEGLSVIGVTDTLILGLRRV